IVASRGSEVDETVTLQAVDRMNALAAEAKQRVLAGQSAPLEYWMCACRMDVALLSQVTGEEELSARASQIVSAVRALRFPNCNDGLSISVSIGAGLCTSESDWAVWYSEADCLLYEVKGQGGDGHRSSP
ncbi:MAG: hypothetical protein ABI650_10245, partial [Dokdonella sp.]